MATFHPLNLYNNLYKKFKSAIKVQGIKIMEFKIDGEVKYLTFKNQISDEVCTVVEICDNGKTIKLKKPNGEIMRIYHDRVRPINGDNKKKINVIKPKEENAAFDPSNEITNGVIWMKQSKFNDSVILKSYVIINHDNDTYKTINAYNDQVKGATAKPYKLKPSLESKLEKKGYTKLQTMKKESK